MSNRKVLLIEPNYKNKYPPMGLMKLAMYYRLQNDDVHFWKGDFNDFIVNELTQDLLDKFAKIQELNGWGKAQLEMFCSPIEEVLDLMPKWRRQIPQIKKYIRTGQIEVKSDFSDMLEEYPIAKTWLVEFRKRYKNGHYLKNPKWDKVGVTTLFTFYWDITIETINFAKKLCKNPEKDLSIGGVLASVVPNEIAKATGIHPHVGVINETHFEDDPPLPEPYTHTPIDALPLDHSILDEIEYQYPVTDGYYAYTTRGCVNRCKFCVVPILEPKYESFIPLKQRINFTRSHFGEQKNLLLLDNNVFASKDFDKIIDEIYDSGFSKNATYCPSNQLNIAIDQLKCSWNDRAYIRRAQGIILQYVEKLKANAIKYKEYYALLQQKGLLYDYTATKEAILSVYEVIKDDYEKSLSKKEVVRFVDFNQGLDARLATPHKMKKLSQIAINPLRIAFDSWETREKYVQALYLAAKYDIRKLSNYMLYNFTDEPLQLYQRLLLNTDLCDALKLNIYSFPMKYHPIQDPKWFSNRDYIGEKWSRKSIRTIQAVLNSTHGKVGRGRTFFFKAFGRNENEFLELLKMPEAFIIKRWDAEICGLQREWRKACANLDENENIIVNELVSNNVFISTLWSKESLNVRKVMDFYLLKREAIPLVPDEEKDAHMKSFEASCPVEISEECKRLIQIAQRKFEGKNNE